jgi:phytoene dehydrogenase-like protein
LLAQYFRGDHTPDRLSQGEFDEAKRYISMHRNDEIWGETVTQIPLPDGNVATLKPPYSARQVFFGQYGRRDAPSIDALLGSATVVFRNGQPVGISDVYDYDFADRGSNTAGQEANRGVRLVRSYADRKAGNIAIPMIGGFLPMSDKKAALIKAGKRPPRGMW